MSKYCEIVNDLLPLYVDDIISEEGRKMVEEHLASCEDCRNAAEKMKQSLSIPMDKNPADIKGMKKKYKKSIWKRVVIIALLLFVAWGAAAIALAARWTEVFPKADVEDIKDCTEIVIIGDKYYLHTNDIFGSGVPVAAKDSFDDSEVRFYLGENGIHNLGLGRSYMMGENLYPIGNVGSTKKITYVKPDGSAEITLFEEGDPVVTLQGTLKDFDY